MQEETFVAFVLGKFVFLMSLWFIVVWEKADKWVNPTMLHPLFATLAFVFLSLSVLFVPFAPQRKILHVFLHVLSFCTFVAPFVWLPRKQRDREELFLPTTFHSFLGFVLAFCSAAYVVLKLFVIATPERFRFSWSRFLFGVDHKKTGSVAYFLFCICFVLGITERQDRGKDDTNVAEVLLLNSASFCCLILGSHYLLKVHKKRIDGVV
ncbi:hypothetical protein GMAR_ORF152 [Golden Marseillevirus]|uniref:hypothetical protein n=1 Tax=Golden Marseillevirus TaxID=1720526 RepID=UPI000877AADF|nr:hypothetical protein GMAR_ORF152 [Golden Marseillevirus]ALX27526.1 hypothetical protein GMAR_ORF152 [Golden Marseillevirus]